MVRKNKKLLNQRESINIGHSSKPGSLFLFFFVHSLPVKTACKIVKPSPSHA